MNDWMQLVSLVVLLAGNAFFVGAEFAVISARRSQIEPKAQAGKRSAKTALWAMEHATLMLATSQLGVTVCSLLILNVSEPAIHHLVQAPLAIIGWPVEVVSAIAFIVALVIVSFLHIVLGELVPKNISFSLPDHAALVLAPPLVLIARLFRPVIVALNVTANGIVRLLRIEPKDQATSTYTLEEVATIVTRSTREGVLSDRSGTLSAAFEFTNKKVRDVALNLARIVSLPATVTPAEFEKAIAKHGFSRYVITDVNGEPIGYLHLKDVIDLDDADSSPGHGVDTDAHSTAPVPTKRIRQLVSICADTDLEDALAMMRKSGAHLARVFDRSGNTRGVLFLEDIIEELVGEVHDATRRGAVD